MTIKEARKLLGEEYIELTDDEIERIVRDLEVIASLTIRAIAKNEFKIGNTNFL